MFSCSSRTCSTQRYQQRLSEDHENALILRRALSKLLGIKVNLDDIHINIVFFDMSGTGIETDRVVKHFYHRGVKINPPEDGIMRFVTHYWVKREDVVRVIDMMKELLEECI